MINRVASLAFFLALTLVSHAKPLPALDLGTVREEHTMIPMRDGVQLSAYIYYPSGEGKWPAIFEQRYADITGVGTRKTAAEIARDGFVVAMVNFRGTHESEGTWTGYRSLAWGERKDGYDVCEWLAKQTWSTGKIGTFGSSQGGFAQNFLAVTRPPHLVCQYMVDTGLSLFTEGYRIGGITRPERFRSFGKVCREPAEHDALLREWDEHPNYDDYWRQEDCSLHFAEMDVPCFTIGSWYDFMCQGSIMSFVGRQHRGGDGSRGRQQIALGPWLHGRLNKINKVGELVFPENAVWPEREHLKRWFNHWLKGEDNGIEREPTVRYYVMGAAGEAGAPGNSWREAHDWPPATQETSLFLEKNGALSRNAPGAGAGSTSFQSDPVNAMVIPGTAFPGAKDARGFEQQAEVRTWTTDPLAEPMEWTGEVRAELHVSSTARDTDFMVRVSDVYPDGRSMLLMDYPMRARYREGWDKQVLLEPGKVATLNMHVGWTSIIFNKGHRIRVTIASTGAPLYEGNNQTGGPQHRDWMKDTVPATNTVWHDQAHPSRLLVPVLKPSATPAQL